MAHLVEGDWKRFTFKVIEKPDYAPVLKHLEENFHQDEPLSIIVGSSELKFKDLERFTTPALDDGLSIVALDKETGKIAGVRLTTREGKNSHKEPFLCESDEQGTIFNFLDSAQKTINIFEEYGLDEYADFAMASVAREFRGEGLATELYERSLKLLRHLGFKLVKSTFTSPYTRKIGTKYGFEELARKYFRELQNTRGDYLCPNADDNEYVWRISIWKMAHCVLGEWKKYTFKLISKSEYSIVIKHLEDNFHQDEPLSVIVGNSAIKFKDLDRFTTGVMEEGLSIALFETATQKLAGACITSACRKSEKSHFHCESEEQATIFGFLESAEEGIDLFEMYDVDEYAEIIMVSVDREFRGEGLATELYDKSIKMLKELGFKLTESTFTSPYTRKISQRFGYEEVSKKYFREIKNTKVVK
ncbi:unnamed protein product [Allacma fusca]|uniref:aralkylamine N-acetyltransferase n=1 Tax=Allacma fusca TaxID=39272 RepID=A0A8J2LDQ0_9HEXA|nr:unnamed protein product [Allacma fusca]